MQNSPRTVLRGGRVVDGLGGPELQADVLIADGLIGAVGDVAAEQADTVIDCSGRVIMPGMIDTHTHADAQVFEADVAEALLRQGVTTVIAGQDGVSYAPGDGVYATDYFAAINGRHPTYAGDGVAGLLRTYDETTPINVGYLVPAGTVRHLIMGDGAERATAEQLQKMIMVVEQGLAEGAAGLSTGLDYAPGCFAETDELTALCRPLAVSGGIYVSHMRGGYEDNAAVGVDEVVDICRASGARGHISHFHARSDLVTRLIDGALADGVDLTFDSYPYSRGCTVLGMLMLPPELMQAGFAAAVTELSRPEVQAAVVAEWIPVMAARADMGPQWADNIRLAHIAAPAYDWAHGLSLSEAADRAGVAPGELGVRILAESRLEVSVVIRVPVPRTDEETAPRVAHPAHMGGSDGIFIGQAAHPRGWGTFARYLADFTERRGDLSWAEAAQRLAHAPAERFGYAGTDEIAGRGTVCPGAVADVIVVDPETVRATSTYEDPRQLAAGIDDVWVNGRAVLRDGEITGVNSGRGLRSSAPAGRRSAPGAPACPG